MEILAKILSSLLYGRTQNGEKFEHPVKALVSHFTVVCNTVYSNLLRENSSAYNQLHRSLFQDIQDFLAIAISILTFFYRRCATIQDQAFVDAVVEGVTYLLFTANDGCLYRLVFTLS